MNQENKSKMFDEDIVDSTTEKIVDYAYATFKRMLVPVSDGLKSVNRRILYLLWEEKVTTHEKMATLAGAVLKYHPHGDRSVSDAMSKMGQWFFMNYILIDPQGNFGTLDGDTPSAARYIEAKPSAFARDVLLDDLDSQCVDYSPNYDFKRREPDYLPAKLPLVLINGTEGLAVAFASSIPPHNLDDVVDRTIMYVKNKNISNDDLAEGLYPDFPTGGEILNGLELRAHYTKGVPCSIRIRAKLRADIQTNTIIVEELPFGVTFDKIRDAIVANRKEKKEESPFIGYLRGEPNNRTNHWEIEFKKDVNINQALLDLLEFTQLETTRTLSLIMNVDEKPKVMTIKEIIEGWYGFRVIVKKRKLTFEMNTIQNKTHVLEGILKCHNSMDEVIATIRKSESRDETISTLVKKFDLTMIQARGIVDMSLGSLSRYSKNDLQSTITANKARLDEIAFSFTKIDELIVGELQEIKKKYGRPRRTKINLEVSKRGAQTVGDISVSNGLLVWTDTEIGLFDQEFLLHGKKITAGLPRGDKVKGSYAANENAKAFLVFYSDGTVRKVLPGELRSLHSWVNVCEKKLTIDAAVPISGSEEETIVCLSKDYKIRQIRTSEFQGNRAVQAGDRVISVGVTRGSKDMILLISNKGAYLYIEKSEVPEFSRTAGGVKTNFDAKHKSVRIVIMNSQSPSAMICLGVDDGEQGCAMFLSVSRFTISKRTNVPKLIIADAEHINIVSGQTIVVKTEKTEMIMIGETDMTSISSKRVKDVGIPTRVPVVPRGFLLYDL